MRDPSPEIAYDLGFSIGQAWTPDDFIDALYVMRTVTPLDLMEESEKEFAIFQQFVENPQLLVGAARSRAVSLGALALLNAPDNIEHPAETSDVLGRYMHGLKTGGLPRWEAKAEVSRRLADVISKQLKGHSYHAFYSAVNLNAAGRSEKIFTWRDNLDVRLSFLAHRIRHLAPRAVIIAAQNNRVGTAPVSTKQP